MSIYNPKHLPTGLTIILSLFLFACESPKSEAIKTIETEEGVWFMEDEDSILFYQTETKSLNEAYARSNYIHPLYSLDGTVLTEDFPKDHLHHRGIFWAWHQLYVGEERIGDGWETRDLIWENLNLETEATENTKSIIATVHWKSPLWTDESGKMTPLIHEVTKISVHPRTTLYRKIDIQISLMALEPKMRIGGSENVKGYGGFSARLRTPDNLVFTSTSGQITPENTPVEAGPWMDFSGSLCENSDTCGVTIFCHPDNPAPIDQWILRQKASMQNPVFPYPGVEAVPLSDSVPTVLKYQLMIHDDDAGALDLEQLYSEYIREN